MQVEPIDMDKLIESGAVDALQVSGLISLANVAHLSGDERIFFEVVIVRRLQGWSKRRIADDIGMPWTTFRYSVNRITERLSTDTLPGHYGLWKVYVELLHPICKARPCSRGGNWRKYEEMAREAI